MTDTPLWFVLLVTLITASAGVAGAVLGQLIAARTADRALTAEHVREIARWDHAKEQKQAEISEARDRAAAEEARNLYVEYLVCLDNLHRVFEVARVRLIANASWPDDLADLVESAFQNALRVSIRIDLLAPTHIALACMNENEIAAAAHVALVYHFDSNKVQAMREMHFREMPRLVAAMRQNLGQEDELEPWLNRMAERRRF